MDLAWNNLQRLICHKTKPNQTKMLIMYFLIKMIKENEKKKERLTCFSAGIYHRMTPKIVPSTTPNKASRGPLKMDQTIFPVDKNNTVKKSTIHIKKLIFFLNKRYQEVISKVTLYNQNECYYQIQTLNFLRQQYCSKIGIWFHIEKKDGANTTTIWSPQRNFYSHNDAL